MHQTWFVYPDLKRSPYLKFWTSKTNSSLWLFMIISCRGRVSIMLLEIVGDHFWGWLDSARAGGQALEGPPETFLAVPGGSLALPESFGKVARSFGRVLGRKYWIFNIFGGFGWSRVGGRVLGTPQLKYPPTLVEKTEPNPLQNQWILGVNGWTG